jgi:hypothetical protein
MADRKGPAVAGDEARRRTQGGSVLPMTFIVRVGANEVGGVVGVVEHAKTGRKERFDGVESISGVIGALMRAVSDPDTREPSNSRG